MKLLNCLKCNDIIALHTEERSCICGQSSGYYLSDVVKAVYSGPARIIGLKNREYDKAKSGNNYTWFVIPEGHNIEKTDP